MRCPEQMARPHRSRRLLSLVSGGSTAGTGGGQGLQALQRPVRDTQNNGAVLADRASDDHPVPQELERLVFELRQVLDGRGYHLYPIPKWVFDR